VGTFKLALIFDMDGVIVDSNSTHTLAWRAYLDQHGLDLPEVESRMLGKRNDEIVRDFFQHLALSEDLVFEHGARKEAIYRDMIRPDLDERLVPGISDFLQHHRDWPIGLATNAEPANVDFILDSAGIRPYFQAIVDGHEVERPKPFPDIYLKVAQKLNVNPADCIVFEDSVTGVQAAKAAGMRVVGVTTTLREIPEVDLTIAHFQDPVLERWLSETHSSA
jgi:beta-phosphoglucomutase family hydrolase